MHKVGHKTFITLTHHHLTITRTPRWKARPLWMERQFEAEHPGGQQLQELRAELRLGSLGGPESAQSPQKHHNLSLQPELDQYHLCDQCYWEGGW